ncbi:P-loop NTPase family protein [Methylobacterium flocculans]|nr:hypothetical protein [Methylobacterium sp. FF17]
MDLAAARIAVETLRKRCIAHGERLDACNVFAEHDDVEKAVTDTARLRAHCDVGLTGCGDLTALARLAEMGETCILLRADGFVDFVLGARAYLAGADETPLVWRQGPPLPLIARSLDLGRSILARREQAQVRETHAEAMDDDCAGIRRIASSAPDPAIDPEPRTEPGVTGLSLVVIPSLKHLPLPSKHSRDRGDSPRALCEDLSEKALALTPAPDPAAFSARLLADYPWAAEVIEAYAQDLVGAPFARFRPRTLVSGAGGGKTSFARSLLRAAGLPEVLYSAAGVMDGGNFAGASRTWSTWRLSVPGQGVLRFGQASLGVIIDEAEKAGPSRRWGRLDETLLPFLERGTTARAIFDPALEVPLDLSGISYILTANEGRGMSGPLLDRAPPVEWPMPRRQDMPIVAAAILDELRRERGLDEVWCPPLDRDELDALTAWRGGSMRPLRRMVEAVVSSRETFARRQPN